MKTFKTAPLLWFSFTLLLIGGIAFLGPEVKELGSNVRLVYLHGAWVMAAEIAFAGAGIIGLLALLLRHSVLHRWSAALGRTGIVFWITYLPLSMWAMQANWNGLFLSEPRFRLALIFAVAGLLLQLGLWIIGNDPLTSLANIAYIILLRFTFSQASNIMHPPPSPIFSSGLWQVIAFFLGLNTLVIIAAYFLTRFWLLVDPNNTKA